jgi:hypothetical protein
VANISACGNNNLGNHQTKCGYFNISNEFVEQVGGGSDASEPHSVDAQ